MILKTLRLVDKLCQHRCKISFFGIVAVGPITKFSANYMYFFDYFKQLKLLFAIALGFETIYLLLVAGSMSFASCFILQVCHFNQSQPGPKD